MELRREEYLHWKQVLSHKNPGYVPPQVCSAPLVDQFAQWRALIAAT